MARVELNEYYKATRPDGTDFYSGTVQYAVGKRVRPRPHAGPREICGPGLLHAADVPAETLVNGSWPCRLFAVTGRPVAGFDGRHPHKGGFRQLTVTRELDAHLALGPNGREAAALIERARRLTADEVRTLDATRNATRYVAWDVAGAAGAAGEAALAPVVRDLISTEHLDTLYAPVGRGDIRMKVKRTPLVRNAAHCHGCDDIIESTSRHDFVSCSCGAIAVDGGPDYARRCFKPGANWTNLFEYKEK